LRSYNDGVVIINKNDINGKIDMMLHYGVLERLSLCKISGFDDEENIRLILKKKHYDILKQDYIY
jgi:hypothetical protein